MVFLWFSRGFSMVFLIFLGLHLTRWSPASKRSKPPDAKAYQRLSPLEAMGKRSSDGSFSLHVPHVPCFCPLVIKHGWPENPRTEWSFLARKITDNCDSLICFYRKNDRTVYGMSLPNHIPI